MFVTLLLAAGLLALEREENAFLRLVRGLVSPHRAAGREDRARRRCARSPCRCVMLAGLGAFVALDWGRVPLWLLALAARRARLRAHGGGDRRAHARGPRRVAAGVRARAAARVPRARALRARSRAALYDVIRVISALFPFKPALEALDAARSAAASCCCPLVHLAALTLGVRRDRADCRCGASPDADSRLPSPAMAFPATRLRRLRKTGVLRDLVRETELAARHLVYPMFVVHGIDGRDADRGDAGHRPPLDRGTRSRRPARPHALGIPAVLLFGLPAEQGRGGLRRLGRRGRRPARHARDQGRAPRPAGDHRRLPVRVHEPRPLRRAARRRRGRQRRDARAARPHRGLPGRAPAPTSSRRAT